MLLMIGCENGKNSNFSSLSSPDSEIPIESLRGDLQSFDDAAQGIIIEAANRIISESKSSEEKRNAIRWKAAALSQLREHTYNDDPLEGLIQTWSWTIRHASFFESGNGRILFIDSNAIAIEAARALNTDIEEIAISYMPKETTDQMQNIAEEYALKNPMQGMFDDSSAVSGIKEVNRTAILRRVATLPATPLLAIGRVGQTSNSIADISNTAERFTDIAEDFPRELRWQAEILSNGLLENEQILAMRQSLESTAQSIDRITVVAENLPEATQEIIRNSIKDIENTSPKIEALLTQANEVTSNLNEGLKTSESVAADLQSLSGELVKTAESWEAVVKEVRLAIADIEKLQGEDTGSSSEEPFSLQQVDQTADKLKGTVSEARLLIADLDEFDGAPVLDELEIRSSKMMESYSNETKSLIDYAAKRIIQIVILIFALSVVILLLSFFLRRKSNAASQ